MRAVGVDGGGRMEVLLAVFSGAPISTGIVAVMGRCSIIQNVVNLFSVIQT